MSFQKTFSKSEINHRSASYAFNEYPDYFFAFKDGAKLLPKYFCAIDDYAGKADLSKGYRNPKRKLGVTTHFFINLN